MIDILLIDDDDLLREHLRDALQTAGHAVREARNGREGLASFAAEPTDMVITDLVMDVGEGVETIITLRRTNPNTPVIAISGNPMYLDHARKLGAKYALLKPFTTDELLDAIGDSMRSIQKDSA